jgi:hypothetical protein
MMESKFSTPNKSFRKAFSLRPFFDPFQSTLLLN